MYERFIVELENNHHYILVDTVTGYQYYTPAQDDALSICGMLNSQQKKLNEQREMLNKFNVNSEYCVNCKCVDLMDADDDDVWCKLKDKSVYKFDWCEKWNARK